MENLSIDRNPEVSVKFLSYPEEARKKLEHLRNLILEVASESDSIKEITETLKWGEPSYLTKKGSTLRIDWKSRNPHQYAMYFSCTTKLVPTFKQVFGDLFEYEKNRAIIFDMEDKLPVKELKECINMALQYHRLKKLPLLGK